MVDNNNTEAEGLSSSGARFHHGAVQLDWEPEINIADVDRLFSLDLPPDQGFEMLDRYLALCATEAAERVRNIEPAQDHMALLSAWMAKFATGTQLDSLFGVEENHILREDGDHQKEVIDTL